MMHYSLVAPAKAVGTGDYEANADTNAGDSAML